MARLGKRGRIAAGCVAVLAAVPAASVAQTRGGAGAAAGGTYTIGWAEAKTGYLALVDQPLEKGMRVELASINARGGIAGKWKIKLDARDMKTDASTGATVAQELVSSGANFLVTTCDTDLSLPGAQIAAQSHIPVMSSCGADVSFPRQVPTYGFLNVPGTLSQGALMAEWAARKGYKRAYVVLSKDEGYTESLAHAFEDRFKQLGGSTVGESQFHIGDTDYRATATKIVNASPKPDVIMTNTFVPDTIPFLRDLQRAGNKLPILLVDGNDASSLLEGGPQLDHATMFTYGGYQGKGSRLASFDAAYQKMWHAKPDSLQGAALGADLIDAVAAAVKAAGSTDGTKVAKALANLKDVNGVTGPFTYRGNGGKPRKLYAIVRIDRKHKRFVVMQSAYPKKVPPARKG